MLCVIRKIKTNPSNRKFLSNDLLCIEMDDSAFQELKESKYHHPILTEVMFDYNMMLEMVYHSMTIIERGYDTVWDSNMLYFTRNYFGDGMKYVEKLIKEKGIKVRIVIEATKENIDYVNSLKHYDIRCLDNLKGNFGIFDNRAYMVYIFHRDSDKPDQTLWSNSKVLVEKQQELFDRLWNMALPLCTMRKEIELSQKNDYYVSLSSFREIEDEIKSLLDIAKREVLILSPIKFLQYLFTSTNALSRYLSALIMRNISIKILTDSNIDEHLFNRLAQLNKNNLLHLGYTNKLGQFKQSVLVIDDKYLVQIQNDNKNNLIGFSSNEEHRVQVQEILFEKYWNEIKSITAGAVVKG